MTHTNNDNKKKFYALFLDVETNDLDPETSPILELGAVITDQDGVVVADLGNFIRSFANEPEELAYLLKEQDSNVRKMHDKSGLNYDLEAVLTEREIGLDYEMTRFYSHEDLDEALCTVLDSLEIERPLLAGFSVHFDREFINAYLPRLGRKLHYRNLDISTLLYANGAVGKTAIQKSGGYTHRALDDVYESINVYRRLLVSFGAEIAYQEDLSFRPDGETLSEYRVRDQVPAPAYDGGIGVGFGLLDDLDDEPEFSTDLDIDVDRDSDDSELELNPSGLTIWEPVKN